MKCEHCGMIHEGQCPRIKAIDYYEDGCVKRIEYHRPVLFQFVDGNLTIVGGEERPRIEEDG